MMTPITKSSVQLMVEGAQALARISMNGIKIDVKKLNDNISLVKKKIQLAKKSLETDPDLKIWRNKQGGKTNYSSSLQLSKFLTDLGIDLPETEKGNKSVGRNTIAELLEDVPVLKKIDRLKKLEKLLSTYLTGLAREVHTDGYIRPHFLLHTVRTFRSSSSNPNFQNIPNRDKELSRIARSVFIPRPGFRLGGIDYSGIEVRIAACYHQDPTMIDYINDSSSDLHMDMAQECFLIDKKRINKRIRYAAKNMFVFPQFYGSNYIPCSKNLWNDAKNQLTVDGQKVLDHLADVGLGKFSDFEEHIRKVEDRFWNERFSVYRDWKDEWVKRYQKKGYIDLFTGFRCSGLMRRNDAINYPIQGSAFHCLLWSLVQIDRIYREKKLTSKIVGQIHDEITHDMNPSEMEILVEEREIMVNRIKDEWKWIIVPLEIEAEFGEAGEDWSKKKKFEISSLKGS